jgi:hypothetical protein
MLDLDSVSDHFLTQLSAAMRLGTYVSGPTAPPPGVPMWIACLAHGTNIVCDALNGDDHVPVGTAIYAAVPSSDWRAEPSSSGRYPSTAVDQAANAIFGGPLTPVENRFVRDLAEQGVTIGQGIPTRASQ